MTIKEFINTPGWEEKLEDHITAEYAPLERKQTAVENIVKQIYADDGSRNSLARYILQAVEFVLMHTDFTITEGDILADFNAIRGNDLVEKLEKILDVYEWDEFDELLDMACSDYEYNHTEPHNFVKSQVERFGELIGASLGPVLEGIDWKGMLAELSANGGTVEG